MSGDYTTSTVEYYDIKERIQILNLNEFKLNLKNIKNTMQPPMSRLQHTISLILIRAVHISLMDSNN